MALKSAGNTIVSYAGTAITGYCDSADLDATLNQLDVTDLASTGKEFISDYAEWKISLSGWWAKALDDLLAIDAVTPGTKRTAFITYTDGANTVTYTWTTNAEIANYKVTSNANAAQKFTGELRLSGAPSRGTA